MGFVKKLDNGRYRARYRGPDGRARSKTFDRKGDAERFLDLSGADIQRGEWVDPALARTTFAQWVRQWEATTLHLREGTREAYLRELPSLNEAFGPVPLGQITSMMVRTWMSDMLADGLTPSRVHRRYRLLRRILNVAVETDHIPRNPCRSAQPPSVPTNEMRFLTAAEVRDLAEAIHPWFRMWIYFAAYTGLRWAEMVGVRRQDLSLVHHRVNVVQQITEVDGKILPPSPPKTRAGRRTVDLPALLCDMLDEQLAERAQPGSAGLVFVNTRGRTPHVSSFTGQVWGRARRLTGLEHVRWHDLRHTAVALAIQRGAHPNAIKERMGHSSITVTLDRYGHLFPSLGEQLAVGLDETMRQAMEMPSPRAAVVPLVGGGAS
jgi:integrase